MTARYFTDEAGNYLGAWDGASPPAGALEVPTPPADARQKWDGAGWLPPPPATVYVPVWLARERLEAAGLLAGLTGMLFAPGNEARLLKLVTLSQGIDPGDPEARAMLQAIGADPDVILAPPP